MSKVIGYIAFLNFQTILENVKSRKRYKLYPIRDFFSYKVGKEKKCFSKEKIAGAVGEIQSYRPIQECIKKKCIFVKQI